MKNHIVHHSNSFIVAHCDTAELIGVWYPSRIEYFVRPLPFDINGPMLTPIKSYNDAFDQYLITANGVRKPSLAHLNLRYSRLMKVMELRIVGFIKQDLSSRLFLEERLDKVQMLINTFYPFEEAIL